MLGRKVFFASAILTGGRFLHRLLDIVATIIIARILTPADYGVVTLATGAMILLRTAIALPVGAALVQMEKVTQEDYQTAFTLSAIRGVLVATVLVICAWPFAQIYDDGRLFYLFLAVALSPLIAGFESPAMVDYVRDVDYTPQTIIDIVSKVSAFVAAVAVAYIYESYWALVIALVAPDILAVPLTYVVAPFRWRFGLQRAREIFSFAGWMSLSGLMSNFNEGGDRFIIGAILNNAAVGIITMGRTMTSSVTWVAGVPLMRAMFPGFSRIRDDKERLRRAFLKAQSMSFFAIAPMGIGLAVVAEPATRALLGEQWLAAVPVVQWLAPFSAVLAALFMPVQACMMAIGETRKFVQREAIAFVVGVPSVVVGLYLFGLMGAVYVRCGTAVLQLVLNLQILRNTISIGIGTQIRNCARTLVSVAAMALVVIALGSTLDGREDLPAIAQLAILIVAGGSTYFFCHWALWFGQDKADGPERWLIETAQHVFSQWQMRKIA